MIQLLGTDGCAGGGGSASGHSGAPDFDPEDPNQKAMGTTAAIGLSIVGLDLPLDIIDFFTAVKKGDGKGMLMSGVGMLPLIGAVKNVKHLDEIAEVADTSSTLIKSTDKAVDAADTASTLTKNADNVVDTAKDLEKAGEAAGDGPTRLFHYTNEAGQEGILNSQKLNPSLKALNPKDVRYGEGQYLSDILPGTKTPAQLSREFLGIPFKSEKYTNFVEIDVTGLNVIQGRPGVFVVPNTTPLDLTGRILSSGGVH